MDEKTFTLNGTYKEKGETKKFTKEIKAVNEGYAKEKAYSLMGSKHKIKRSSIQIEKISEKK